MVLIIFLLQVYVGPSAALSFLQLLRDTFASRSGTWYAEREGETEALLDVEFTSQDSEDFACLKDQKQLNDYVLSFSAVVSEPRSEEHTSELQSHS